MNIAFPPPQRWQDFEELTLEAVRSVFADPGAQGHGRTGQPQAGVDVYGREKGSDRLVGVQCKRKEQFPDRPASNVTIEEIKAEVKKAETFAPSLDFLIIATTGSRDTDLQAGLRFLQEERLRDDKFSVGAWFWEDFIGFLNNDARLSKWYLALLQGLYGKQTADKQILAVMRTAFSRAAFRTPLSIESPGEFRQALLDTERAVNTGLLLDRETRMPICRAPGGLANIAHDPQKRIPVILGSVQKARRSFDLGASDGRIKVSGFCVVVENEQTRNEIDFYRRTAIRALNELLTMHGESTVDSPLLSMVIAPPQNLASGQENTVSGLHHGSVPVTLTPQPLFGIVDNALKQHQQGFHQRQIGLDRAWNVDRNLRLDLDRSAMTFALETILHHASTYAYDNTQIRCHTVQERNYICISVEYSGLALPSDAGQLDLELESRREQASSTSNDFGADVVRACEIVRAHGGSLGVNSIPALAPKAADQRIPFHRVRFAVRLPIPPMSGKSLQPM